MMYQIFTKDFSKLKIKKYGDKAVLFEPFEFSCRECGTVYEDCLSSGKFEIKYHREPFKVHQEYTDALIGILAIDAECIGCGYDIMLRNLVLFKIDRDYTSKAIVIRHLTKEESNQYF